MSIYKRGATWWLTFTGPDGRRVRRSAGTGDKLAAQELHDQLKADAWRQARLGERPRHTWSEAVVRWLRESTKRSLHNDRIHLRWIARHWPADLLLDAITRDRIEDLSATKQAEGVAPATVNRLLEVVRAILRRAEREWEWIERAPVVRMLAEPKRRVRWITREEADRLLAELPVHLRDMAGFTLATGLRERNVTELQWSQIDLKRRIAWIHPDQAKAGKAIAVPLNADALAILRRVEGEDEDFVFVYQAPRAAGKKDHGPRPVTRANNHAWRKALKRAGIEDFRWHDLRHTWASWHVQAGTPLPVLRELGGWATMDMVLRYAHLGANHLAEHAERIAGPRIVSSGTNRSQPKKSQKA